MSEQESTRGSASGNQGGKPSLVASGASAGSSPARPPSILAAMGHDAEREADSYRDKSQPNGASRRWLWPVLAVLLLGGLLWALTRTITPSSPTDAVKVAAMPKPAAVVEKKAEPVQPLGVSTVATVPMAEVPPQASDAVPPAARLEDAPDIKKADEARQAAADAANAKPDAVATAPSASKKTQVRSKPAVAANNPEVTRAAQRIITAREVQREQEVARQSPSERISGAVDSDVELVSALISHGSEGGAGSTASAAAAPAPTIASLVQQCRALEPSEASACRKRICAGYWGKAQACPMAERTASAR